MASFRVVLVGAGGMGRAWARNLVDCEDTEIAGWLDVHAGAVKEALEQMQLSGVQVGSDEAQMLADLKPDFVVDVTPPQIHREVTLTALARSIPVLGEKPMADSMAAAREMVAASEATNTLYMVSQSRRYNKNLHAFRGLINELGGLGILNADFELGPHFGGFRDEMLSPLLLDMAIHTFDQARFLSGADPVSVYCEEFNPEWSWYQGAACANALFTLTGNVRYAYRGSWCAEGMPTSWEGDWRAVGGKGTSVWLGDLAPRAELAVGTEGFFHDTQPLPAAVPEISEGIAGSLRDFMNALRTGATPMGECHDNIKSLAMVFGAIESAQTGQRVAITPLLS